MLKLNEAKMPTRPEHGLHGLAESLVAHLLIMAKAGIGCCGLVL